MDAETRQRLIGREVKRVLSNAGWSARRAAAEMGISHETVYRWMRGENQAPIDELAKLAEITGQPITIRLGDAKEEPPPQWARVLIAEIVEASQAALAVDRAELVRLAAEAAIAQQSRTPGGPVLGNGLTPPEAAERSPGQ